MQLRIIPFKHSVNNCYLIQGDSTIMIDAGYRGCARDFQKFLQKESIRPEEIRLIVLTHGDFDHAGGADELKALTGAKVAIHEADYKTVTSGAFHWPPGTTPWGRFTRRMFLPVMKRNYGPPEFEADILLNDQNMSLIDYGLPGEIVHTPGHTPGSVSVLLESGEAFIGCLAHNRAPFTLKPRLPIYAVDVASLRNSWEKILQRGVHTLYPAHGKSFGAEKILASLG